MLQFIAVQEGIYKGALMNKIRHNRTKTAGCLLILLSIVTAGSVVCAETVTWNAADGNWNDDTKWTPAKVPVPADDAVVGGMGTVAVDADVTVSSLTVVSSPWTNALMLNSGKFTIGFGMILVPGGCFQMGDTFGDGISWELPVHQVCLSSFYIDRTEVTQGAYQSVTGTNPSHYRGDNLPVEKVSWFDADSYCKAVGNRLLTEAEWEYAARSGGQSQRYAGTSDESSLRNYAWYWDGSYGGHPAGQKLPNGLGLHDMSGNIWEWVADWYDAYSSGTQSDPQGPATGVYRIIRGGSWLELANYMRASSRNYLNPGYWDYSIGFRCARTN